MEACETNPKRSEGSDGLCKPQRTQHVAGENMRENLEQINESPIKNRVEKGNYTLPHRNCSGSQLFCTSNPTTPRRRTRIQSEAAITGEAAQPTAAEITFSEHGQRKSDCEVLDGHAERISTLFLDVFRYFFGLTLLLSVIFLRT